MAVKLGDRVEDSITGFSGIVMARSEYLYGCVQVLVQPEEVSDGKIAESLWLDEQRLTQTSEAVAGGPQRMPEVSTPPKR